MGRLEHNFRVAGIDSKTQQGELLKTSLEVIDEESNESVSRADDLVSSRSSRAATTTSKLFVLNSYKELRKPHVPKYKKQEEGKMFGVEARKFFGMNDGMKEEAFHQQQRAVN